MNGGGEKSITSGSQGNDGGIDGLVDGGIDGFVGGGVDGLNDGGGEELVDGGVDGLRDGRGEMPIGGGIDTLASLGRSGLISNESRGISCSRNSWMSPARSLGRGVSCWMVWKVCCQELRAFS